MDEVEITFTCLKAAQRKVSSEVTGEIKLENIDQQDENASNTEAMASSSFARETDRKFSLDELLAKAYSTPAAAPWIPPYRPDSTQHDPATDSGGGPNFSPRRPREEDGAGCSFASDPIDLRSPVSEPKTGSSTVKGLGDFGQTKKRRASEIFLTMRAPRAQAKEIFVKVKKSLRGKVLVVCPVGPKGDNLLHALYLFDGLGQYAEEFKTAVETICGYSCVQVKRVNNRPAVLKSMKQTGFVTLYCTIPKNQFPAKGKIQNAAPTLPKRCGKKAAKNGNPLSSSDLTPAAAGTGSFQPETEPTSSTRDVYHARAEERNPHKAAVEECEAKVKSLEKSLMDARAELQKAKRIRREWNLQCAEILRKADEDVKKIGML